MDIAEILNLAVVGGILSAIIEFLSGKMGAGETKVFTVLLSILVGTGYYFLSGNEAWFNTVVAVLVSASTVYAFIIKKK